MTLYALKCDEGYIKVLDDGYAFVGLDKASVYKDIESIKEIAQKLEGKLGLRGIEMTLTEREIMLFP